MDASPQHAALDRPANSSEETHFRRTADVIPAMIWMTDANHLCSYLNRSWQEFTGLTVEEGLGRGVTAVFHPDDRARITEQFLQAAQRLEPFALEYRIRRADGEYRWVVGEGRPRLNEQGQLLGYVGCVIDVHDQKMTEEALRQSEEELLRLNDTLELQVAERTQQLREREARLAKLAWELTRAEQCERTRLARVLHDQVQQLLVAAKMRISLASMDAVVDSVKADLNTAQGIIDEAIETVRTLSVEMCPPILHVRGLGAGLQWLATKMHRQHGLTVDMETDPGADPTDATLRDLLFQTARELLLNVVKHAQTDHCQLRLRRQQQRLVLEVIDQGVGFRPQAEPSPAESSIGLFHIRERLRHVGGELEVASAPGQGTRATVIV